MTPRTKGILCMIVSAFGFALMAFFVRLCDDCGGSVSSFQKSFFRNALALTIAVLAFARHPKGLGAAVPTVRGWGALVLRSALGTAGIFANFYALSHITIAEGQTLNKTAPFFTVLFAWLFLRERTTPRQFGVLTLAFVGVLLIAKPGLAGADAFPLGMGLLGGVCAGGAYACVRSMRTHGVDAAFIILFFSAFSCLSSVPFMLAHFDAMTWGQVLSLCGAGAGAAIGQFGITFAYGYARPREIAVYDYSNILFTAALGFAFFGQIPDGWSLLGCFVILLAGFLMGRTS